MITRVVGSILSGMPHVPEDRPHRGSPARQFSGATAGHEAQTFSHSIGIFEDGEAIDESVAIRRQFQRGQNPHAGRLAGPVGTDITENLPAANFK